MSVAIIPARGGSQRIPRKNIQLFHGKPIIAYSIETALATHLFDRVIVSTDDDEIALTAAVYGAEIHRRSADLARDEVGTQEVASAVIDGLLLTGADLKGYSTVCVLYATAPLVTAEDIIQAEYRRPHACYTVSVSDPLQDAGAFYLGSVENYLNREPLINPRTRIYPLPKERVCDINTWDDFHRAEKLYAAMKEGA